MKEEEKLNDGKTYKHKFVRENKWAYRFHFLLQTFIHTLPIISPSVHSHYLLWNVNI